MVPLPSFFYLVESRLSLALLPNLGDGFSGSQGVLQKKFSIEVNG